MKTLIIFSTVDNHTKKISDYISRFLDSKDDIDLVDLEVINKYNINDYNRIIIGASIRYGKFRKSLYEFISKNKIHLDKKISCFFGVNLVARKKEKNTPETNPYIIKFLKKTKWQPNLVGVFAGSLEYSKYKISDKFIIKFIMWITDGPTDTSKDYEFTNWEDVKNFSKKICEINHS